MHLTTSFVEPVIVRIIHGTSHSKVSNFDSFVGMDKAIPAGQISVDAITGANANYCNNNDGLLNSVKVTLNKN